MPPKSDETRALARYRSLCRSPEAKALLQKAFDNGWNALAIDELASRIRGPIKKIFKRDRALQDAASRRYYSPEEYAADLAAWERSAEAFRYLRSVCRDFKERLVLGEAIRNGWGATALTKLAESFRTHSDNSTTEANPKLSAYRRAIHAASERLYEADKPVWLMQQPPNIEKEQTT
jgi:hypothetical protein